MHHYFNSMNHTQTALWLYFLPNTIMICNNACNVYLTPKLYKNDSQCVNCIKPYRRVVICWPIKWFDGCWMPVRWETQRLWSHWRRRDNQGVTFWLWHLFGRWRFQGVSPPLRESPSSRSRCCRSCWRPAGRWHHTQIIQSTNLTWSLNYGDCVYVTFEKQCG